VNSEVQEGKQEDVAVQVGTTTSIFSPEPDHHQRRGDRGGATCPELGGYLLCVTQSCRHGKNGIHFRIALGSHERLNTGQNGRIIARGQASSDHILPAIGQILLTLS
jgi:hypothetical protein